jgi:hypothetical protein
VSYLRNDPAKARSTFQVKKSTGFYPRVHIDTTRCSAVGQAGGILLTDTIRTAGLDVALSAALAGWRKPTGVHDPAKMILDLAVSLALGGDCLADVAVFRGEPDVFGRVASDPTISRTVAALPDRLSGGTGCGRYRPSHGPGEGVAAGRGCGA